ncbi:MAG: PIN-like domain-containing protein [Brachybacterium tyrofermentans]|uniref:PIN-like domain-containing protein n=2 Tax=Brachybacterium tyrofermentans TaxID=47848 RepID=UPI003FB86F0C
MADQQAQGSSARTIFTDFVEYAEHDALPADDPVRGTLYALDANILLNLYKFTPDAARDVLKALREMREVLFIPHQALNEFWPLRAGVRSGPHHSEASGKVRAAKADILRIVRTWQKRTGLNAEGAREGGAQDISDHLAAVSEVLEKIESTIDAVREESADNGEWLLDTIDEIFAGRIGPKPSDAERTDALREFDKRVERGTPPGLRDVEIRKGKTEKASGDYFIWMQCVREAESISNSRGAPLDLTLVTEDHKDDWVRSGTDDHLLAHRALVKEYYEATGGTFRIMSFEELLDTASQFFGAQVSSESRAQVAAQKTYPAVAWTPDYAYDYLTELWNYGNLPQLKVLFVAWHLAQELGPPLLLTEAAALVDRVDLRGFGKAFSGALARMDVAGVEDLEVMLKRVDGLERSEAVYEIQGGAEHCLGEIIEEDSDFSQLLAEGVAGIKKIRVAQ